MDELQLTATAPAGVAQEAVELHGQIMGTYQAINQLLTRFCRMLKEMRDRRLYTELGVNSFEEYVEGMCGIKARQAYTYISTYERLGEERMGKNAELGITKLSVLAKMFPPDADELAAENDLSAMSVKQVEQLVEQINGQSEQISLLEQEKRDLQAEKEDAEKSEKWLKQERERLSKEVLDIKGRLMEADRASAAAREEQEKAVRDAVQAALEEAERTAQAREQLARQEGERFGRMQGGQPAGDDSDTVRFMAFFDQLQAVVGAMNRHLSGMRAAGKADKADKLRDAGRKGLTMMVEGIK